MKRLVTSSNSAELGLLKSRLEVAGIQCEVRNESISQGLPGVPFDPEIWVLYDEDYGAASEFLAHWRRSTATDEQPWIE